MLYIHSLKYLAKLAKSIMVVEHLATVLIRITESYLNWLASWHGHTYKHSLKISKVSTIANA